MNDNLIKEVSNVMGGKVLKYKARVIYEEGMGKIK